MVGRLSKRISSQQSGAKKGPIAVSSKLDLLLESEVFRGLSPQDMQEIERLTTMTTCRRGRVFYTPGETGEVLFVLKKGRVQLYRVTADGKKLITTTVESGTVFGEMSLVGQGMYDSFAEAAQDCVLCVMSRSDVAHLIATKPRFALTIIDLLGRRLIDAEGRLETLAFKSVPARLATTLLRLAADGDEVVGVSHQDLADIVGSYRETITRILNELRSAGVLELGRERIRILSRAELRALVD